MSVLASIFIVDRKALFKFTTNATSQGKWYFFLDESWPYAFREADCDKKIAMARFTGGHNSFVYLQSGGYSLKCMTYEVL